MDLPDRDQPDGYLQLAQALSRAGGQTLAIDTPTSLDLQRLSTAELRDERDRLRRQLDQAPRDRSRELARASAHRPPRADRAGPGRPPAARRPAARGHASLAASRFRQVVRVLAWQRRATGLAIEVDRPGYVLEALRPVPASTRGRRAWRQAAAEIEHYRHTYQITDPDRALGPEPHHPTQRADRQRAHTAIDRVRVKQRAADYTRDLEPTSERSSPRPLQQRGRPGPERAAG